MSYTTFNEDIKAYGIRIDSAGTITRVGLAKGMSRSDFDNIPLFNLQKRCTMADAGTINHYFGEGGYLEDGSDGQVVVKRPAFYYAWLRRGGYDYYYASDTPCVGLSLHPAFMRNSVYKANIYPGAYEGSAYAVGTATSVKTLTITAGATDNGNVTVVIAGTSVDIPVLSGDTAAQVATKIRLGVWAGWTQGGTDPAIIWTAISTGYKSGANTFSGAATGVTATAGVINTTLGEPGYITADDAGLDFTATTGDKMCSIAGAKPVSGWRNTLTIANARQLCKNRGSLWNQFDVLSISAIQLLFMIEYASCNSQSMIGLGVTDVTDDGATNCSHVTGLTTALGNASGRESGTENLCSVSYRGIENLWGNIWKFIDGVNIKADNGLWIADNGFISDTYTSPYKVVGTLINTDGYFKTPYYSENNPIFFPSAVGGSSSTYFADYYYQTTGNRIAVSGGRWVYSSIAGLFLWGLSDSSGDSSRYIGARLMCLP